ncbi:MAG: hypothetical protein QXY62_01975 [Candidatus Altiarchaeota archaeon]
MSRGIPIRVLNEVLSESLGKEHISIIKKLSRPMYDEDLAADLGLKATVVRTLLNELHAKRLVEYERIKNKATGWYTYIWKKREDMIESYVKTYLGEKINQLNTMLENEKTMNFKCSCGVFSFDEATNNSYICPSCNEPFTTFKNSKKIRELKREIERAKKIYNKIQSITSSKRGRLR